jgi:Leucine-rich repeat (LRR) protein
MVNIKRKNSFYNLRKNMNYLRIPKLPESISSPSDITPERVEHLCLSLSVEDGGIDLTEREEVQTLDETYNLCKYLEGVLSPKTYFETFSHLLSNLHPVASSQSLLKQIHTIAARALDKELYHPLKQQEFDEENRTLQHLMAERIEKALYDKAYSFSFSSFHDGRRMRRGFPDIFYRWTNLLELDLSGNFFDQVPPSLGALRMLQKLDLSHNQLTTVPREIFMLVSLRDLKLASNKISSVPEEVCNLRSLQNLSLNGNRLLALPEAIGQLRQLTHLNVEFNLLTSLPPGLWDLEGCIVELESNRFSCSTVAQIQAMSLTRISPIILHLAIEDSLQMDINEFGDLNEAIAYWRERLDNEAQWPDEKIFSESERVALVALFSAARRAPQAQHDASLPVLAKRLHNLLVAIDDSMCLAIRPILLYLIKEATSGCGDRVEFYLVEMELVIKFHRMKHSERESKHLYQIASDLMGLYYWQGLRDIAADKAEQLRASGFAIDEIEVYLAYLIHLKERLSLPIEGDRMLYERCSGLKEVDYNAAYLQLKEATNTIERKVAALCSLDLWCTILRKRLESELTLLHQQHAPQIELHFEHDGEALSKSNTIHSNYLAAEKELLFSETLKLLAESSVKEEE